MIRRIFLFLIAIVATTCSVVSAQEAPEGFASLFDGKTLDGWVQKNGTATYEVVDGTIKGTTAKGSPNSFLCTEKNYGDFELRFEVKVDPALNSGVQVRSVSKPDYKNGRVHGTQVEIAETNFSGYIYSEGTGRGWITKKREKHEHLKSGQWNKFRVVAQGNHIKTWINDSEVMDTEIPAVEATSGFIGLQVHAIPKGKGPFSVAWKNISIKELGAEGSDSKDAAEMQTTEPAKGSGSHGSDKKKAEPTGAGSGSR